MTTRTPVFDVRSRLLPAAFIVWAFCLLLSLRSAPGEYLSFFRELIRGLSSAPSPAGLAAALGRHAVLLGTAGALAAASYGGGLPLLAFLRSGLFGLEGACYAVALGWAALGFALFGLALTGLFYPGLIVSVPAAAVLAGFGRFRRAGYFKNLREPGTGSMWVCALLGGTPFFLLSPFYLSPPVYVDFSQYHMAAPEHFLKLHRFMIDGTNPGFHLQLTTEMINALGLVIGNSALAVLSGLIPFASAVVAAALWVRRIAGPEAAGLAMGFSLVITYMFLALGCGKNDSAAAGFCLLAVVSQARGRVIPAALLYGISCAVKMNGLAFAGVAWLWYESGRIRARGTGWRPWGPWIALAALPVLPWFLKEFLLMGDPVWPVFSRWLSGALLDAESQEVLAGFLGRKKPVTAVPGEVWDILRSAQPVLAFGLPLVLLRWASLAGEMRKAVALSLAMLAGYALVVNFDMERKAYPLIVLWCFALPAAAEGLAAGLPAWVRRLAIAAACVAAWAPVARNAALSYNANTVRYLTGTATCEDFIATAYTTIRETQVALARLPGVRSVLLVSEHAPYMWPGRVRTEEFIDRKPTWVLATRAWDPYRMYVRLKQENVTHLVLNFIADGNVGPGMSPYRKYPWEMRSLRLLRDFMREHTEIAIRPIHCDPMSGGFYVYRITPRAEPCGLIYYLPGTQEAMYQVYRPMFETRNNGASLAKARDMIQLFPEVGQFQWTAGLFALWLRDWPVAYGYFHELYLAGMVSDYGHGMLAQAALNTNHNAEGGRVIAEGRAIYTQHGKAFDHLEASFMANEASAIAERGGDLVKALDMARRAVAMSPDNLAMRTVIGIVQIKMGNYDEAERVLRGIMEITPGNTQLYAACAAYLDQCARGRKRGRIPGKEAR